MLAPQWQALALTLAIELPVIYLSFKGMPVQRVVMAGLCASLGTHPMAWWAASYLSPHDHPQGVWIIEVCVTAAEALFYLAVLRVKALRAGLATAAANIASFSVGAWLWA